jgi:predicted metal-binding membrane protein
MNNNLVLMWLAMMLVMMAPAAALLARAYGTTSPAGFGGPRGHGIVALIAGYLGFWSLFGLVLAAVQEGLTALGFFIHEGRLSSQLAGGVLLTAAGLYQFTPWKQAWVARCRTPFIAMEWGGGVRGALRMGALQGLYCIGCCWLLFAALFALGTMHIGWMAALLAVVLAERHRRVGPVVTWAAGLAVTAYGLSLLITR